MLYKSGLVDIDWIYGEKYYADMDRSQALRDAEQLVDAIIDTYSPSSVVAFGCGTGRLLYPFSRKNIEVYGIDASSIALEESQLPREYLEQHDLTQRYELNEEYDIALAIEILEHLPSDAADTAVASIAESAPVVLVSAATPGQGGTHHVNEQPSSYWIEKFENEGMQARPEISKEILSEIDLQDLEWIQDNLLVFENE